MKKWRVFKSLKNPFWEAWFWLALPSILFCIKYTEKLSFGSYSIALVWVLVWFGASHLLIKVKDWQLRLPFRLAIVLGLATGAFIVFEWVPSNNLQVDRWSVIIKWWQALLSGNNPYLSVSHLGNSPGPFPFFFLPYLPFYFLGEVGWLSIFCLIVLFLSLRRGAQVLGLLFLLVGFLWELLVRSNLTFNALWVMLTLIAPSFGYLKNKWLWAFAAGIALCTRSLTLFPLLTFLAITLGKNPWGYIKNASVTKLIGLIFLTAILPFCGLWWAFPNFWKGFNPITFQATVFMPSWMVIVLMLACFFTVGIRAKRVLDFYLQVTRWLSILFICYLSYVTYTNGFYDALYGSQADISYFNFVIPFGISTIYLALYPEANKALLIPGIKLGPS